jgi:uncharacterized protein
MVRSVVYFDTSAQLKLYVTESGSAWVQALLSESSPPLVLTSPLTLVEVTCAFARRLREGFLTTSEYNAVESAFDYDVRHAYGVLEIGPFTLETARRLARQYPLRAYDAVHLSAAWLASERLVKAGEPPLTFICADDRLLASAQAEGMSVENPNHHS